MVRHAFAQLREGLSAGARAEAAALCECMERGIFRAEALEARAREVAVDLVDGQALAGED